MGVHTRGFDRGTLDDYRASREEMDWLASWAEREGLVLEIALNGYYAEGALAAGEEDHLEALAAAGHEFGVHHHPSVRTDDLTWVELGDDPTDEDLQRSVDDHRAWIGQALDPLDIPYPGGHVRLTGRTEWWYQMMVDAGYETETADQWITAASGGETPEGRFDVLRPFRWQVGGASGSLHHDADVPFIAIPQHPQVGIAGMGEHLGFDGAAAHLEVLALLAYLEWRAAVLAEGEAGVWAFGFASHPERGPSQNEELNRLGQFLSERLLDPTDGVTAPAACAVGRSRIVAWVRAWEDEHPGEAPFDLAAGGGYPYRLPQLQEVYATRLVAIHDDEIDRGVRLVELRRVTVVGEGDDAEVTEGEAVWLAWADVVPGGEVLVDLRDHTEGPVSLTTSTGTTGGVSAAGVPIGTDPVVITLP